MPTRSILLNIGKTQICNADPRRILLKLHFDNVSTTSQVSLFERLQDNIPVYTIPAPVNPSVDGGVVLILTKIDGFDVTREWFIEASQVSTMNIYEEFEH